MLAGISVIWLEKKINELKARLRLVKRIYGTGFMAGDHRFRTSLSRLFLWTGDTNISRN